VGNRPKWYVTLLAGLILLLASVTVTCSSTPEHSAVKSYLADTEAIINEATNIASKVSSLYKTARQLNSSEVVQKCATYGKQYDDILGRFVALQSPPECYKLREYAIEGISYSKQEVTEFGAAFATGDMEHLYKAESHYNEAQKALALAAGEWEILIKQYYE